MYALSDIKGGYNAIQQEIIRQMLSPRIMIDKNGITMTPKWTQADMAEFLSGVEHPHVEVFDDETDDDELRSRNELKFLSKALGSSIPESYIIYYLRQLFPDTERTKQFYWLGNRSIDIFIPSLSIGIEYDGSKWHDPRRNAEERHGKNITKRDREKSKLCRQHNTTLLRIRELPSDYTDVNAVLIPYRPALAHNKYVNIGYAIVKILQFIKQAYKIRGYIDVDVARDSEDILEALRNEYRTTPIRW